MPSSFGEFTGNTVGEAAAFAAGLVVAEVLKPVVQELANTAWSEAPSMPLDAEIAAEAVSENALTLTQGQAEAALTGIGPTPFATLVEVARKAPGISQAQELVRRANLSTDLLHHAYEKAHLEKAYWAALDAVLYDILTPQQIALGMVRGTVDSAGLLAVDLDTSDSNVPKYPVYPKDGIAEALEGGLDEDRLRVLVGSIGLPMGAEGAARAYFRGILTIGAYYQAILEGDTRPEWADKILEAARQILTAHDGAELRLRGIVDQAGARKVAELHGMSDTDADLLYEMLGRGINAHQVTTGLARGGTYDGPIDTIPIEYLDELRRSSTRPEYFNLAYANRYTLPGYFVIKAMLTAGSITEAEGAQLFKEEGWPPDLADKAAAALAGGTGGGKALTATQIKDAVKVGALTQADALSRLEAAGHTAADAALIFAGWNLPVDTAANEPH